MQILHEAVLTRFHVSSQMLMRLFALAAAISAQCSLMRMRRGLCALSLPIPAWPQGSCSTRLHRLTCMRVRPMGAFGTVLTWRLDFEVEGVGVEEELK
jgi:hypothetical protein